MGRLKTFTHASLLKVIEKRLRGRSREKFRELLIDAVVDEIGDEMLEDLVDEKLLSYINTEAISNFLKEKGYLVFEPHASIKTDALDLAEEMKRQYTLDFVRMVGTAI